MRCYTFILKQLEMTPVLCVEVTKGPLLASWIHVSFIWTFQQAEHLLCAPIYALEAVANVKSNGRMYTVRIMHVCICMVRINIHAQHLEHKHLLIHMFLTVYDLLGRNNILLMSGLQYALIFVICLWQFSG
mgnify:CR=1 FL=1